MTLADFLVPVAPALDAALIDAAALAAIRTVAGRMPAALGLELFGFECDLSDPRPVADFLVSCTRRRGGAAALAAAHDHPAVARFAAAWDEHFDDVWLELDVSRSVDPIPSVFFAPTAWRGPACLAQADAGLRLLGGAAPALARIVDAIPEHAGLFQIGRMLARPATPVRVCVGPMLPDVATAFLTAIDHPARRARDELARLAPLVDAVAVGLDLDGPRLGIECYRTSTMLARHDPGDARLLDALDCVRAKADGLARWPGYASVVDAPTAWPPSLDAPARFATDGTESFLVRRLHHVKVTLDGAAPPRAKAYLAVQHRWRRR